MRQRMPVLTALAFLAGAGVMVTATTYAQTSGGDRRDDRRDNRQGSRAQKQACKAGDENRLLFLIRCIRGVTADRQYGEQHERDENHAVHGAPPENAFGLHYTPALEILRQTTSSAVSPTTASAGMNVA